MIDNSTIQLNKSLIECVTEQTRVNLEELLRRTRDDKEFHTNITIELLHSDNNNNNNNVHIENINISPICDVNGNVIGVVFANARSFYSIMNEGVSSMLMHSAS